MNSLLWSLWGLLFYKISVGTIFFSPANLSHVDFIIRSGKRTGQEGQRGVYPSSTQYIYMAKNFYSEYKNYFSCLFLPLRSPSASCVQLPAWPDVLLMLPSLSDHSWKRSSSFKNSLDQMVLCSDNLVKSNHPSHPNLISILSADS